MRASASDGRVWPEATDDPTRVTPGGRCNVTGEPNTDNARCNYAAEIENLDRLFKVVLDEVEAQGELENTLVVATSDHGEMLGDHGDTEKSKPWQGSAAVPLVVAGPGVPQGRVVESPVGTLDLVGTFLDYAGVRPDPSMDTVTLRGVLDPSANITYRPFISSGLSNFRMVVKELNGTSYKYICCHGPCPNAPSTAPKPSTANAYVQMLIDVAADPFDMKDLSNERPEVVSALLPHLVQEGYSGNFTEGCLSLKEDQYVALDDITV